MIPEPFGPLYVTVGGEAASGHVVLFTVSVEYLIDASNEFSPMRRFAVAEGTNVLVSALSAAIVAGDIVAALPNPKLVLAVAGVVRSLRLSVVVSLVLSAVCVAVDIGLATSDVSSTFVRPIVALVIAPGAMVLAVTELSLRVPSLLLDWAK